MSSTDPGRHFLAGSTDFVDQRIAKIRESIGDDISEETFYGDEMSPENFSAFINTPPLFEDGKLAILKNANRVKDLPGIIRHVGSCVESTVIIVQASAPGKEVSAAIKEAGFELQSEGKPKASDEKQKVMSMFKEAGFPIDWLAAEELYELNNRDISLIRQEVEKLSLYFGDKKPDGTLKVLDVLTNEKHANIFDFIDRFSTRDTAGALRLFRVLLSGTQNLSPLFFLLFKRINAIYMMHVNPSLVSEHPFAMKKIKEAANRWSRSELSGLIDEFAAVDFAVKTGGTTIDNGLIRLIDSL